MLLATARQTTSHRPGLSDYVRRVGKWVVLARASMAVARERRQLMLLDDHMLKDIGIGRSEAFHEASKGFTDLPYHRMPRF